MSERFVLVGVMDRRGRPLNRMTAMGVKIETSERERDRESERLGLAGTLCHAATVSHSSSARWRTAPEENGPDD